MKQKAITLINRGMNRDMSISKVGDITAFENHNIRILAKDHDTLLSVTNERGTKQIENIEIEGTLLGWNVLNEHLILFTHKETGANPDYIYRIDYSNGSFVPVGTDENPWLYNGNLNFHSDYPIESVVYHETDSIQKIYWIDGRNVLRFMNFMQPGNWDDTSFDTNRASGFGVVATISKDNSGTVRANGVVQYILTYYNKHGQETGRIWASDLVYLSPDGYGGSADGTNTNSVTLTFSNMDTSFDHFRVYSIVRNSVNGTMVSYIVADDEVPGSSEDTKVVVDDGAHLTLVDTSTVLYLGSQPVKPNAISHKDQTLFLGGLSKIGRDYSSIETAISDYMFYQEEPKYRSRCITFDYSDDSVEEICDIPYASDSAIYPYNNQLQYTSSEILSFKGNEKYRFALKFKLSDGTETDAFWIGDAENDKYPIIDSSTGKIKRVIAKCVIPAEVLAAIREATELDIKTVQLLIAEATYSDRSVKAQGFINPTMFNTWERYNNRLYSIPSWISRPRGSEFACRHFESVHRSTGSDGEIQCNFWEDGSQSIIPPYFRYKNYTSTDKTYYDTFDGVPEYTRLMIAYAVERIWPSSYNVGFRIVKLWDDGDSSVISEIDGLVIPTGPAPSGWNYYSENVGSTRQWYSCTKEHYKVEVYGGNIEGKAFLNGGQARVNAWRELYSELVTNYSIPEDCILSYQTFDSWCVEADQGSVIFRNTRITPAQYSWNSILNYDISQQTPSADRWMNAADYALNEYTGNAMPSNYRRNLMFVDENVITMDSPEIAYESVSVDNAGLKLRIVGIAKMSSVKGDYTVDAVRSKLSAGGLSTSTFSWKLTNDTASGALLSWPLWREASLDPTAEGAEKDKKNRKASDYTRDTTSVVGFWLYLWNHAGIINEYSDNGEDGDEEEYSKLTSKTIANMHIAYETLYDTPYEFDELDSIRQFNSISSQYLELDIDNKKKYYDGYVQHQLTMPGTATYPVLYSMSIPSETSKKIITSDDNYYLRTVSPVTLDYGTNSHAVIALHSEVIDNKFHQTILPKIFNSDAIDIPDEPTTIGGVPVSEVLIPWIGVDNTETPFLGYTTDQENLFSTYGSHLTESDRYMFIGELYEEYDNAHPDTRYGGISEYAVQNNRFIAAGPQYEISQMPSTGNGLIYGNQGDTYFQRWDCVRTKPYNDTSVNKVIDITSVMLETHINLDGRTDRQRYLDKIASLNLETYGDINNVYSQPNNAFVSRDLDEDFNQDSYLSSVIWSQEKHDSSVVDEWTHVSLASSLKLDGDRGQCRAIRRFANNLIAFQDKGIAEILFNSRTQLSTTNGTPIELANSGKVDGKRYLTSNYGCVNKWSITEGRSGLYFVDNINKAFCVLGQSIQNLSELKGFGTWFRRMNDTEPWKPSSRNNIISFFDGAHSDIYLVTNDEVDPCLVYNEMLGEFTSFFDYSGLSMMANIQDKFVSFRDGKLWLQNEGWYGDFFGSYKPFWTWHRVNPSPISDKIWTNIDYRADVYSVLDDGCETIPEAELIGSEYKENETFDTAKVWNEYQTTGEQVVDAKKKFRIWRYIIPRASKTDSNKYGLDRIRNPWVNILFKKEMAVENKKDMMQIHDLTVRYFE